VRSPLVVFALQIIDILIQKIVTEEEKGRKQAETP
jgi:hypothetical protein